MQAAENAKTLAMAQGQQADNLSWANRVQSMQDDIDLYTYVNSRALATNERIGNESQVLTNQIWKGRVAADNLLATIRKSKEHIHAQLKAKEDKVNTLLELVEQDPEIKKRLDEVMLSKSK